MKPHRMTLISISSICRCDEVTKKKKLLHHIGNKALYIATYPTAPYEICPEDYAVSMVWRRTPSGELAFNRCPPNATGTDRSRVFHVPFVLVLSLAAFCARLSVH